MSFNIALSGLNAASMDLSTISNNVANVATTGFKGSRTEFGDIFRNSAYETVNLARGAGVAVSRVAQQFGQGTITATGNTLDLAINGKGFFTVNDNGTTLYSRSGAFGTDADGYVVNASGQRLQVYPPDPNGNGFSTFLTQDLQLSASASSPRPTDEVDLILNLPATASEPTITPFDATDADTYNQSRSMTVYDTLGAPHTATLFFVKQAGDGAWALNTTIDGTAVGTAQALQFDSSGQLTTPTGGLVNLPAFTPTGGAADLSIELNLSGTTQQGDSFTVGQMTQNGYPAGELSGFGVTADGIVEAHYTNGNTIGVGQLAMVNFVNEQGLRQVGNVAWQETFESGQPLQGVAGGANFGDVQAGALEGSNVDLTEQLVNMMTAQRNYQANSQVISVTDQLMQVIMNLR